ncbi:MAG: aldo/keto reductase [Patescibacteria group bacterium]
MRRRIIAMPDRGNDAVPNQIVLAWLAQQKDPAVNPLVAASVPDQLRENLHAVEIVLTDEETTRLE